MNAVMEHADLEAVRTAFIEDYKPERRLFSRLKTVIPVRFKYNNISEGEMTRSSYKGITKNISAGGLLLHGQIPSSEFVGQILTDNIEVLMNFQLPHDLDVIKVKGKVVWVEKVKAQSFYCTMGVKFTMISSEAKNNIFRFIAKAPIQS